MEIAHSLHRADEDTNGGLDAVSFEAAMSSIDRRLTQSEIDRMFRECVWTKDQELDIGLFCDLLHRRCPSRHSISAQSVLRCSFPEILRKRNRFRIDGGSPSRRRLHSMPSIGRWSSIDDGSASTDFRASIESMDAGSISDEVDGFCECGDGRIVPRSSMTTERVQRILNMVEPDGDGRISKSEVLFLLAKCNELQRRGVDRGDGSKWGDDSSSAVSGRGSSRSTVYSSDSAQSESEESADSIESHHL